MTVRTTVAKIKRGDPAKIASERKSLQMLYHPDKAPFDGLKGLYTDLCAIINTELA